MAGREWKNVEDGRHFQCVVLKAYVLSIFLDSSMVEHSAVNRVVAGSSPARGVKVKKHLHTNRKYVKIEYVKAPWSSG